MFNKTYILLLAFIFLCKPLSAQVVYVPLNNEVYNYLTRAAAKGYISLYDETRPWSRTCVAGKLLEIRESSGRLTNWEKETLEFYEHEYSLEMARVRNDRVEKKLTYLSFENSDRFRFIYYTDSTFTFSAEPILGYEIGRKYNDNQLERHNGINLYGSIWSNIGFSSNIIDNREEGKFLDTGRLYSDQTGFIFRNIKENAIEYDYVNANIDFSWKWGSFGIAKDYLQWGSGERGQLIFSTKAPSFPFIRLKINPVEWFEFNFIHGWLNSNVVDSSSLRRNLNTSRQHYSLVDKFIASHLFTFRPFSNLSLSVGESVVYSDKIQPIYFIPVLSFRMADHYVMNQDDNEGGNAQIFADVRYKNKLLKSIFYLSLFIDELSLGKLFNSRERAFAPTEAAYTIGGKFVDPLIDNSELVLEYTRINPYIYIHSDDAQFYSNYKYQLGHWLGSNSDLVYFSYDQKIIRGLGVKLWGEFSRKGTSELTSASVVDPYPDFLYGPRRSSESWGIEAQYEVIYDLKAKLAFQHSNVSDEDFARTPAFQLGNKDLLGFSLSYGF